VGTPYCLANFSANLNLSKNKVSLLIIFKKKTFIKLQYKPVVLAHTHNPSTSEAKAEGSPVQDQPGLHVEACLKKTAKEFSYIVG
jgi:hypothetical protein